jgi:DNA-binding transcriptional ArsR family regulator
LQSYLCVVTADRVRQNRVRLSAHNLRGIAHPLRVRLLNLLREEGPSTATRLAERTGQTSGATSYHLRQLAAYGFVVEEPTQGGRERWWKAYHKGTLLEAADIREMPQEAEAYMRAIAAEYAERTDRWISEVPELGTEWDEGATLSNYRLRLTATETTALLSALNAVIAEYRKDDPETAPDAPDGAERVDVHLQVMPFLRRNS